MNIINPIQITEAIIDAATNITEPSSNETAWSPSSVSYVVGDIRIRSTTHRKYKCAVAHTSAASPVPENDPTRWVDIGPTDLWAPFDIYTSTKVTTTEEIKYVLKPGFFNSVALYGLTGTQYEIIVKDETGGNVIYNKSGFLSDDPLGWYEYLFSPLKTRTKLIFTNIPIRPDAELTIRILSGVGQQVSLGMIVVGDYTPLLASDDWGGTQYGSSAEPVTYSYINTAEDGTVNIVRRHSATNLRARVHVPQADADYALLKIQENLDNPIAWIATDAQGYSGLTTFGLGSATVIYESPTHAVIEIFVKGLI
jgi:hypothetical protein